MSRKEPGYFTRQVFGESLESLQDENKAESMPVGAASSEVLDKSPSNEEEDNSGAFKATTFAPHPPEKPKDLNQQSPGRNKKKKRFFRPSNRVGLQSHSSDGEQHANHERLLDNRTTGGKLPPLSKDVSNDLKIAANSETINHTNVNRPIDENLQHPIKLSLKPLSPIKDCKKVAHDFREKQSLERGKHDPRDKGPIKPPNPIDKVSTPYHSNGQTSSNSAATLDSDKPTSAENNNNNREIAGDKSENTLTSVSSNDSGSDSDSDSQLGPVHGTNSTSSTHLTPKAPSSTPPTHHRHHRSSLSLNSVNDQPEQVDRHSDTEAVRRRRTDNHRNSKELWGRAKYATFLPRVPASRARDRSSNFIQEELEKYLPEQKLTVFIGTWNMHGEKQLPTFVDDFLLPECSKFMQDLYVIGSQESTPLRKEWEIKLQEALGPSHVLIHSSTFGVLHLALYLRRELVWFCSVVQQATIATRPGHMIKTKGAIGLSLSIFGTSFLFINSHFTAHEHKWKERIGDYRLIRKTLSLPLNYSEPESNGGDVTTRFNRVFWLGDFNFRVEERHGVVQKFLEQCEEEEYPDYEELVAKDQMTRLMKKNDVFEHFQEAKINFPPTYRFDINPDDPGHYSSIRVPSWTVRGF